MKRSYFPISGEHYSDEDFEAAFNGVEFQAVVGDEDFEALDS
jgi:hypothetical protein